MNGPGKMLVMAALCLALAGCGQGRGGEDIATEAAFPSPSEATEPPSPAPTESLAVEGHQDAPAETGTSASPENGAPQPLNIVPNVGGDYMPEQNEQIASLYQKALAAAGELGYGEGDVLAAQTMEPGFKMVQILARRPEEASYVLQINVYEALATAEESFQLLLDSGAEQVQLADGGSLALNALTMPDPITGELVTKYMASLRRENGVISVTEADKEAALESVKAFLERED